LGIDSPHPFLDYPIFQAFLALSQGERAISFFAVRCEEAKLVFPPLPLGEGGGFNVSG